MGDEMENRRKDKDEDEYEEMYSPFYGIEKGAVLQEVRLFNEPQPSSRGCAQIISKLLYLQNQGEVYSKEEASKVFFAVTKLFQVKDVNLRRLVYLIIKEIPPTPEEVIIVISSLMKDINSAEFAEGKGQAIRVLCKVTDVSLLGQIERYIKQGIVDKDPAVSSAALVSGLHLLRAGNDLVKRWVNEVQEAATSGRHSSPMVAFHALALLHKIRQGDRLAVSKLVASVTRSKGSVSQGSVLAQSLLVRYAAQCIADMGGANNPSAGGQDRPFADFIESSLRNRSETVIFEAARTLVALPGIANRELQAAVQVLQLFLTSPKPVLRFAAVRALNKVALTQPSAVSPCNVDMEGLMNDPNRAVATLAITTLLKTSNEGGVDRLLQQLGAFIGNIGDEFRMVVLDAVREMCLKYRSKHRILMTFLSNILREEGGFEYKKAIVDTIVLLVNEIPESKESGLLHLCEFIEDCEFTSLSVQILDFLSEEGPSSDKQANFIRYIYNRVMLENEIVRASAVSTLYSFGLNSPNLRPRIITLLARCVHDNDDEVRDRATLYREALLALAVEGPAAQEFALDLGGRVIPCPIVNLKSSLETYITSGAFDTPFDIESVSTYVPEIASIPSVASEKRNAPGALKGQNLLSKVSTIDEENILEPGADTSVSFSIVDAYMKHIADIPQLSNLGMPFISRTPEELTESETEYVVSCVKHIYKDSIVFQFNITNSIPDIVLDNVSVVMEALDDSSFEEEFQVPSTSIACDKTGHAFIFMRGQPGEMNYSGKFACSLKFMVREIDPNSGHAEESGYEDEYVLEELELSAADFMRPMNAFPQGSFRASWDNLGDMSSRADEYGLGYRNSLDEAISAVCSTIGTIGCEGTDKVPSGARSHTALLAGTFITGDVVLVRLGLAFDATQNVLMKLVVRSTSPEISELMHALVGG